MRTKIIATLGPASMDYKKMKAMVEHGARIFRLNFSHSSAADFVPVIEMIRELEQETNIPLTVMGDLCGPKVRIGEVVGSPLQIHRGRTIVLGLEELRDRAGEHPFISVDMPELLQGLQEGMPVSLSDGMLRFQVTEVMVPDGLYAITADNGGILTSNKGIAFPGKFHPMPAMTEKDRVDLHEGLAVGLDAVAMSFVQNRRDIDEIKAEIERQGTWIPVIAKVERKNAVEELDSILAVADGIMVARGDLGLECSPAELPIIQKKIIRACRHARKSVIVATQMLLSMVRNPLPTRAESTDVANAVLDGADAVMLSEETAIGSYPVEAVQFMERIADHAETYYLERINSPYRPKKNTKDPSKYLAYSACLMAHNTESKAVVCHSVSGATAKLVSTRRPEQVIYALTPDKRVLRALNFFWGVHPMLGDKSIAGHLERAEKFIETSGAFQKGEVAVITAGLPTPGSPEHVTNAIKVYYL